MGLLTIEPAELMLFYSGTETLGPDFALKELAYTASGDPDKWKRARDRRPVLDPDAVAEAMGIPKKDVHRYLREARIILRQVFNADGRLFQIQ